MLYREGDLFVIKICPTIAAKTYFTTLQFLPINLPNVTPLLFYFFHNFEEAFSTLSISNLHILSYLSNLYNDSRSSSDRPTIEKGIAILIDNHN